MGYSDAKAFVNANIKTNGNQEITGSIMNTALNKILDGSAQELSEADKRIHLEVFGEVNVIKNYYWSNGFVAGQTILNSQVDQFCQPVLFKAGERLVYKTNDTYGSAVVRVADDTPLSVGSTGFNLQTLIQANVANMEYEYVFGEDMWVVISVHASDYSLNVTETSPNSLQDQVDDIDNQVNPKYTNNNAINAVLEEMYINGYRDGYFLSYFIWNGNTITIIVRDSQNNIILFANTLPATIGEVFAYTENGVTIYAILNEHTHAVSPVNVNFDLGSLNIAYNPRIFGYIVDKKTDLEYPLNISRFDQGGLLPAGHRASWITMSRRMDNESDAVFNFANKTYPNLTNKWFDFYAVGKHARSVDGVSHCSTYIDWDEINSLSSSDALMMAVIVGAVHNIDGDNLTEKWHTGGAHAYGDSAVGQSPTMRELSNVVLADGKEIPVGELNVKCRKCTIDVVNNIQGYNTCKADGSGREILQQRYHVDFTNDECVISVEYVALEDVIIYGANVVTGMNVSDAQYRFIGSRSKRGLYTYNGSSNVPNNGDNKISRNRIIKNGYAFDVDYDLSYGIGNQEMENSFNCYVTTAGKSYYVNIPNGGQLALSAGESINWRIRLNLHKLFTN